MTHIRPDADGLGAQLALHDALTQLGKSPRVAIASKLPPRYDFLDPAASSSKTSGHPPLRTLRPRLRGRARYRHLEPARRLRRLSESEPDPPRRRRSPSQPRTTSAASGSSISAANRAAGWLTRSPRPSASRRARLPRTTCSWPSRRTLAGFRHPKRPRRHLASPRSSSPRSHPTELYEKLYEAAPLARLKLTGVAIDRLKLRAGGKIAYTEILLSDYVATGACARRHEDLINFPRSVEGVEVALVFIEQPATAPR